jgi:hypothetical protein
MTGTLMSVTDSVATSALTRWLGVGQSATVVPWDLLTEQVGSFACDCAAITDAIVVPSTRTIECVVNEEADWALVLGQVSGVIELGWTVTVLTPLSEMGAAHEGLRGSRALLQGWWLRTNQEMHFGRTEIA